MSSTLQVRKKRSWLKATMLFLKDPKNSTFLKFLVVYGPFDLVDDVVPVVGQLDDWYFLVWPFVAIYALFKVRKYR